jgi:hypothetical protein
MLIASVKMYFDLICLVSMYLIAGMNKGAYFVCYDSYPVCNCSVMVFLYVDCIYWNVFCPVSMYLINEMNKGAYFVCYDSYPVCNCSVMVFLYVDCIYRDVVFCIL